MSKFLSVESNESKWSSYTIAANAGDATTAPLILLTFYKESEDTEGVHFALDLDEMTELIQNLTKVVSTLKEAYKEKLS